MTDCQENNHKMIRAPGRVVETAPSVFLAGSIEMGAAEDWQQKVFDHIKDLPIIALNPRRLDWDSSWEQSIENEPFREQVTWELNHLRHSDVKFFYFQPGTISPVTMLEMGTMIDFMIPSENIIVVCPPGFHRKGNIDIFCLTYAIRKFDSLEEGMAALRKRMAELATIKYGKEYK